MKIAQPRRDKCGQVARSRSVAVVRAVAAVCVGKRGGRWRRDATEWVKLMSETRCAARPGGGEQKYSGQGKKHDGAVLLVFGRGLVLMGSVALGGVDARVNGAK